MKVLCYCLLFPHFTHSLLVSVAVVACQLFRPRRRAKRLLAGLLPGVLIGCALEWWNIAQPPGGEWLLPVYYVAPLILGFFLTLTISGVSCAERIQTLSLAYLCQHIGFCLASALTVAPTDDMAYTLFIALLKWTLHLLTLAAVCRLVIRKLPERGHLRVTLHAASVTFAMVLLLALGLNFVYRNGGDASGLSYYIGLLYDLCCCSFLLWIQLEQRQAAESWMQYETERRLRIRNQERYEQSRKNVALINRKCHDLKRQLAALHMEKDPAVREQGICEMERAVLIYDAVAETGNEVLDTLLTEKSLICEANRIIWTCMADGKLLNFMRTADVYTLFEDALDNAIEASREIEDPQKRVISVTVREANGMALIQIENYFSHPVVQKDGLPVTTKPDAERHGYGLKSVSSIAESYNGLMDIHTENGIFLLSVLIRFPSEKTPYKAGTVVSAANARLPPYQLRAPFYQLRIFLPFS